MMGDTIPKAPADKPEPSAFERMKEFTRRLIAVPKTEVQSVEDRQPSRQGGS